MRPPALKTRWLSQVTVKVGFYKGAMLDRQCSFSSRWDSSSCTPQNPVNFKPLSLQSCWRNPGRAQEMPGR